MHNGHPRRGEKGSERISEEIMAPYSPNLKNIQEAKQTPSSVDSKKFTPRHFRVKLQKAKDQERTWKAE